MKHLLLAVSFLFISYFAFGQDAKPAYVGVVEYTKGQFGSFSYPQKGDSVYVYTDFQKISCRIFGHKDAGGERIIQLDFKSLKLIRKKEFMNIVSPTQSIPTGNYDMKLSNQAGKKGGTIHIVSLTHYGDGKEADLTILGENDGARLDDICVVKLVRVK